MNTFGNLQSSSPAKPRPAVNPLANALAETEQRALGSGDTSPGKADSTSLFSDALARAGGSMGKDFSDIDGDKNAPDNFDPFKQHEDSIRKQQHEALRRKLHEKVNPVDTHAVYVAKEERVKKELDETRKEIKSLLMEIKTTQTHLDIEATKVIVTQGTDGTGLINFLQKFRAFVMLLKKQIRSARTWMQQAQAKQSKKKRRKGAPGLEVSGQKYEQTKTVFDQMHHERSNNAGA